MTLPTLKSVTAELHVLKSTKKPPIAQRAMELLNELQTVTSKNEEEANIFSNKLRDIITNPNQNDPLIETLYRILLVVALICPRNQCEDGRPVDPISLRHIEARHLFISIDRYQWSIQELSKYIQATKLYINPVTRLPFAEQDIEMMNRVAITANIPSPLVATERLAQAQVPVVDYNRTFCCPIFRFFSARPVDNAVAFQNYNGEWQIPPISYLNDNYDGWGF